MFDSDKKVKDIEKSLNKIIKPLKSMEVTWTKQQDAAFEKRIKENMKKKERCNAYGAAISKRCKQHGGSIIIVKELQNFVIKILKEDLNQNEIILQRLIILLESSDENEREEQIDFPFEDQMMNMIQNKNKENTSTN